MLIGQKLSPIQKMDSYRELSGKQVEFCEVWWKFGNHRFQSPRAEGSSNEPPNHPYAGSERLRTVNRSCTCIDRQLVDSYLCT